MSTTEKAFSGVIEGAHPTSSKPEIIPLNPNPNLTSPVKDYGKNKSEKSFQKSRSSLLSQNQKHYHQNQHNSASSQSDQEEKKHTNPQELKEFRAKTIDRIIAKRREFDQKFLQYTNERKKESAAFRMNWKENLKRQRLEAILTEVDKRIVRNYTQGDSLNNILRLRKVNEEQLSYLTEDLQDIDDIIPFDKRKDSGVYTISLKDPSKQSKENSDDPRTRRRSASIEFNSGRQLTIAGLFLQYISSYGLSVRTKVPLPWLPVPKLKFNMNSENDTKKLSNQLQINELLDDILIPESGNNSHSPRRRTSSASPVPVKGYRLPKGYMLEVLQECLHPQITGKIGRSLSMDESVNFGKNSFLGTQAKDVKNENPTISSIIDGCFLIGPDQASIVELMIDRLAVPALSTKNSNSNSESTAGSVKIKASPTQTKHILQPKVLYRSEFHFPPEMLQLLPSYCFPR